MKEYLTLGVMDSGAFLTHARRFTEDEKKGYADWFKEVGFVSTSKSIELDCLYFSDYHNLIKEKNPDGSFIGCSNQAYIISEDEWNSLLALNKEKRAEKIAANAAENKSWYESVIKAYKKQGTLYTREEAEKKAAEYNEIYNEGGEGYVPHFYTVDEFRHAKEMLKKY